MAKDDLNKKILKTIKQLNRNRMRANARTVTLWGEIPYYPTFVGRAMRDLEKQGYLRRLEDRPKSGYYLAA